MPQTVTRKRVEILTDEPLLPRIIAAAADAGISGYTLLPVRSGSGRGGAWRDDWITSAQNKTIFLTIAAEDKARQFVRSLVPVLDSHGLLLTIGDVEVVRGERF